MIKEWNELPDTFRNDFVYKYYIQLRKRKSYLLLKRVFDIVLASILSLVLSPVFFIISALIVIDSEGPVIFRQIRVTQYGKKFIIYKFRTMVNDADKIGNHITTKNDFRVTKIGKILRSLRLDEIPQLLNIIKGEMSFVGTRPEDVIYTEKYTEEMMATLLLPAGVTSEASIHFKNEELLLAAAQNVDDIYVNEILPEKMKYNLKSLEKISLFNDIKILFKTVIAVIKKDGGVSC
jgi:lipopolysaccharide/colanic/teichoic acid biosynthesis glycosyltransferase